MTNHDRALEAFETYARGNVETIAALEAEIAHLKKENASLWETVHELQDQNATGREATP